MKAFCVKEAVAAVQGELLWGDEKAVITQVVTDSRKAGPGTLFVPIVGERVDAHRFIPDVLEAGATASFTADKSIPPSKGACIYVEDTLVAMQRLAAWYRSQFDIPMIGVTGSVGKTTTKEMIAAVLGTRFKVEKTIGNLNSQIGVAQMMFHLDEATELAVIEMGISLPGEMARLVEMVRPQTAVMTNIGVSHIGNLKTRGNITKEKGHIVKYVGTFCKAAKESGKMYICGNGDLKELSQENIPYDNNLSTCETVYYGTENDCDIQARDIEVTTTGQTFVYVGKSTCPVELMVMGGHNVNNALIAMALGEQFGIAAEEAAEALRQYRPFSMRGERKDCGGFHLIDDTYNASPDSINSNIDALFDYDAQGNKIAVLGDVLELGEQMEELHRGIGDFILEEASKGKKLSCVITVGEGASYIGKQVQEHSDIPVWMCDDTKEAAEQVMQRAKAGDWILVKGSRGMQMDKVIERVVISCTQM